MDWETRRQMTKDVVIDMLRENTGRSILDSGGTPKYDENGCYIGSEYGYGRAYERNRCIAFDKTPEVSYRFDTWRGNEWSLDVSKSVYHTIVNNYEYDDEWQRIFDDFCECPDYEYEGWLQLMYKFGEMIAEVYPEAGFGVYGESGSPEDGVTNTYNDESTLSQVLQFMEISIPEESDFITLIQIHNGADVRGGYTAPKVFRENGTRELPLHMTADVTVICSDHNNHTWYTDDNYHYYWNGWDNEWEEGDQPTIPELLSDEDKANIAKAKMGIVQDLNKYKVYVPADDESLEEEEVEELEENPVWKQGYMFIDDDNNGYCPICGGKLLVY